MDAYTGLHPVTAQTLMIAQALSAEAEQAGRDAYNALVDALALTPPSEPPTDIAVALSPADGTDGGPQLTSLPDELVDPGLQTVVMDLSESMQGLIGLIEGAVESNSALTLSPIPTVQRPKGLWPGDFNDTVTLPTAPSGSIPSAPVIVTPTVPSFPTIDLPFPDVSDLEALEADLPRFSYTEQDYTPHLATELEARIRAVFADGMGLPQTYWDSMWSKVSADLQRQQQVKLRAMRNSGSSSFWGLPAEASLANAKEIIDETAKAAQTARLEMAQQQAVMVRDDFWKAMDAGTKVEQMWITLHDNVANRALQAAQHAVNSAAQIYNLYVAKINSQLGIIKGRTDLHTVQVETLVKRFGAALDVVKFEIDKDKNAIERAKGQWEIYKTDAESKLGVFAEKVKIWTSRANSYAQVENIIQNSYDLNIKRVATLIQNVSGMASAAHAIGSSMSAAAQATNSLGMLNVEGYKARTGATLDLHQLYLDANKARADLKARYTEWANNQKIELNKLAAELKWTYATAALNAADVSLGTSTSAGYSESASRNLELEW